MDQFMFLLRIDLARTMFGNQVVKQAETESDKVS